MGLIVSTLLLPNDFISKNNIRHKIIFDIASCPRDLIESWNLFTLFLLLLFLNSEIADDAESVYFIIKTTVEPVRPKM